MRRFSDSPFVQTCVVKTQNQRLKETSAQKQRMFSLCGTVCKTKSKRIIHDNFIVWWICSHNFHSVFELLQLYI